MEKQSSRGPLSRSMFVFGNGQITVNPLARTSGRNPMGLKKKHNMLLCYQSTVNIKQPDLFRSLLVNFHGPKWPHPEILRGHFEGLHLTRLLLQPPRRRNAQSPSLQLQVRLAQRFWYADSIHLSTVCRGFTAGLQQSPERPSIHMHDWREKTPTVELKQKTTNIINY